MPSYVVPPRTRACEHEAIAEQRMSFAQSPCLDGLQQTQTMSLVLFSLILTHKSLVISFIRPRQSSMQWLHALQLLTDTTLRSTKKFLMLEIPSCLAALSHGLSGGRDKPQQVPGVAWRWPFRNSFAFWLCPLPKCFTYLWLWSCGCEQGFIRRLRGNKNPGWGHRSWCSS